MTIDYPPRINNAVNNSVVSEKSKDEMSLDEYKQWVMNLSLIHISIKLYADDIIYIETELHKNVFYTEKGTFQIYKKLDELENEFKEMCIRDSFNTLFVIFSFFKIIEIDTMHMYQNLPYF